MRIALAQVFCGWGEMEENLRRAERYIRRAAAGGADLVVFPEMSVHGMWKNHLVRLAAEPLNGPIVRKMRAWARRHRIAVGFGFAEKSRRQPCNSYVLLDRHGRLAGVYRKNFITVLEKDFFRQGTRRPLFQLGRMKVGIGICADCHRRQPLASYGQRGADLVLMPHAWDADPLLKGGKVAVWRDEAHMVDAFATHRVARYRTHDEMLRFFVGKLGPKAARGGFYAAFVNPVGRSHPLIPFVGPAFVLDPQGRVLARSRSSREALVMADLSLVAARPSRRGARGTAPAGKGTACAKTPLA